MIRYRLRTPNSFSRRTGGESWDEGRNRLAEKHGKAPHPRASRDDLSPQAGRGK